jgi:hypothetical protein
MKWLGRMAAMGLALLACGSAWAQVGGNYGDDFPTYPLRVHIFSRRVHHNRRFDSYSGSGRANLIEGDTVAGMEFTYLCSFKFLDSDADEYYPAKWRKDGQSIDILFGKVGSDSQVRKCQFKVLRKEFVYARDRGKIVTLSPAEYAGREDARAERQQAMMPADLNPSHYPLDFALLHVAWTGSVSGMQTGSGQGNVREADGMHAVDFSIHCPVKLQATPEGRFLAARWLEPGKTMLLLLRSVDVDGAPGATCQMVTAVGPDVYVRSGGGVKAVSQAEFAAKRP